MSAIDAYFAASEHPYWQWQDDGNVVAWSDGVTIVFRPELLTVFRRLQTQSLPPFGAIVLLLAACHDSWRQPPSRMELLSALLSIGKRMDRLELLTRVATRLDQVSKLDAKLRTTPEAKAELAAMVFEGQGVPALPGAYDRLIDELEHGLSEEALQQRRPQVAVDRLLRDLAWLDKGLDRVDGAALALRLRTGLEQPLAPPEEIELSKSGLARQLLADLKDDEELGGVARLARLLLAAVQMPIPLSLPEELPIGGVSDISNRGSLDRLLLSELANDGLTLAVRVAMNEALYLRRETPPRPPSRRRLVLLDSGLRMWGVPRVFATSVGLALAAGAADGIDVTVYRAAGLDLLEVDMTTAEGLKNHLAALEHRAHPGDSLPALAEELTKLGDAVDVVLVTGPDVYADRDFQRQLNDEQFAELHVATVGRDGAFRLHLHSLRGRKVLKQAQFALDDLLRPPTKPTVRLLDPGETNLPAIFAAEPFPLLLSHQVDVDRSWHVHEFGALTYARDGRLLHWTDSKYGARQIAEGLPLGNLHWAATRADHGEILAVIGKLSRDGLRLLKLSSDGSQHECIRLETEIDRPKYAFVHQGIVFVGDGLKLNACSRMTGKLTASRLLGEHKHVGGRIFAIIHRPTLVKAWTAASFNGTEITLTEFYAESQNRYHVLTVLETSDHEGPIGLLNSGELINFGTNQKRTNHTNQLSGELEVKGVSRNGLRLWLRKEAINPQELIVDVKTLLINLSRNYHARALEEELYAIAHPASLRHRFSAIGVDAEGRLTLVGRRDTLWPLTYLKEDGTLRLPTKNSATPLRFSYPFEPLDGAEAKRYSLEEAKFADGSRAVLDARGLLHLKSSDGALPELTIVLAEGATAGWLSTGEVWGAPYFLDEQAQLTDRRVKKNVLAPFTEHLR